jgi:transcriptional regulator with XRE-family HTH domain
MKTIHSIIYKRRQQLNYTQSFVALKMNLSQKQFSRIESGETNLKLDDYIRLCKILEMHPCDILDEANLVTDLRVSEKSKLIGVQKEKLLELEKKCIMLESMLSNRPEKDFVGMP